jgi:hypothetical protein
MSARVVVLGCGPAGLISAYAAEREYGAEVKIVSVKRPSQLYGCQYLHEPIPGITLDSGGDTVHYELNGTTEEYRRKVYGSLTPPVSPQQYAGSHLAWDLRQTYATLWNRYEDRIVDAKVTPEDIVLMLGDFMPDACISSLPAPVLCQAGDRHAFTSVKCWALGDAPEYGQHVADYGYTIPPFTVWCDGTKDASWYRMCNVFGYSTIEWPGHKRKPPIQGVAEFYKPLSTDCDCMPSILRVGRYGRWQKGVLSHQAYQATANKVKEFA